jgi:hypothetical protein
MPGALRVDHAAQLDFLTKLQRILNEGTFVASYKFRFHTRARVFARGE